MDKGVRVKIDFNRVVQLGRMYEALMRSYGTDGDHEELLMEHMREMHHRLKLMAVREQDAYTMVLTNVEAMAFKQTWQDEEFEPASWDCQIIKSITDRIGKRFHDLKTLRHARAY